MKNWINIVLYYLRLICGLNFKNWFEWILLFLSFGPFTRPRFNQPISSVYKILDWRKHHAVPESLNGQIIYWIYIWNISPSGHPLFWLETFDLLDLYTFHQIGSILIFYSRKDFLLHWHVQFQSSKSYLITTLKADKTKSKYDQIDYYHNDVTVIYPDKNSKLEIRDRIRILRFFFNSLLVHSPNSEECHK